MNKQSFLGSVDKLLILTVVLTTVVSLAIPLPTDLVKPGFSSFVLFEDPAFLITYVASLVAIGMLWFRLGEHRIIALLLTTVFSILSVDLWELKVPGGNFLYSGPYYASITNGILQSGHLTFLGWGTYPSMFLISSELTSIIGLPLSATLAFLDIFRSVFFGLFFFLIISHFVSSPRLVAAATMLSIIADAQIVKDSPFNVSTYGLIFFLIIVLLLLEMSSRRKNSLVIPFAIASLAGIMSYPMIPFMIILILLFSLGRKMFRSPFRGAAPKVNVSLPNTNYLIAFSVVPYVVWTIYVSQYILIGPVLVNNILTVLFGSQNITSTGSPHGFTFYLSQLLLSNVTALPDYLGYLLPLWFIIFFGGGTIFWFVLKLLHTKKVPQTFLVIPILITGILLFLLPGGSEWDRILVYVSPFIAGTLFVFIERKRLKITTIVTCAVLFLTLPTIVAYYPLAGTYGAQYSFEFYSGNFVNSHLGNGNVYVGSGIVTLNYTFNSKVISALSTTPETPTEAQNIVQSQLQAFRQSQDDSIISLSPLFLQFYEHLYGVQSANTVHTLLQSKTGSFNLIYTNGFTQIYSMPR